MRAWMAKARELRRVPPDIWAVAVLAVALALFLALASGCRQEPPPPAAPAEWCGWPYMTACHWPEAPPPATGEGPY